MGDVFTTTKRSWVMSRIRGTNTGPERTVRSFLHGLGFRFRVHVGNLPGRPDIVLARYKTAIMVNGCFWHHHCGCQNAVWPSNRSDFWRAKIEGTIRRDKANRQALRKLGWSVITVWECQAENPVKLRRQLSSLISRA